MEDLATFSPSETALSWHNLTSPLLNRIADLDSDSGLTGVLDAIRLTASQGSYRSRLGSTLEAEVGHNLSLKSDNTQLEQLLDKPEAFSRSVSEMLLNNHGLLRQPVVGLTTTSGPGNETGAATDSLTGTTKGASLVGASERPRPNVVVILADDLSKPELNQALAKGFMPNLKTHLIDRGTKFVRSYVTNPWCCPSRATFLTGQYSHNHGVLNNDAPTGGVTQLDDSSTVATWLQQAGYRTGLVGKYLNRYGEDLDASDPSDDPTYIPPGWDDWQARVRGGFYNYTINDNGRLIKYEGNPTSSAKYQDDVLAQRSVNFINESEAINDKTPFFLYITPRAPHVPATPPPRYAGTASNIPLPKSPSFNEADVSDKPAWLQRNAPLDAQEIASLESVYQRRLETLRPLDDLVGRVVRTLKQNGELQNTVLMFTSDNGYLLGEHRLKEKPFVYEEAIRVPLFIRAPGFAPQMVYRLVINNDLAPTIADFAGATPDIPVDGRSLIPLLQEPNLTTWRKRFLVEVYRGAPGTRSDRSLFAVRTGYSDKAAPNQLYVEYEAGDREFYDLKIDPYQLESQHNSPARQEEIQILKNYLTNLKTSSGESSRMFEDA